MKNFILKTIACIAILSGAISCKKETAVTRDTIRPKAALTISGNGLNKTFYSDSSYTYGQLNLKPNAKYHFILSGVDTGGLRTLEFNSLNELTYEALASTPHIYTTRTSAISRMFTVTGDASNPYVSFLISGDIITQNVDQNEDVFFSISGFSRDYAGLTGNVDIPCATTYTPVGGYGWVGF
ncbi:MAG: hypothetical protein U0U67_07350 [Chitinophagales bacterium]